jgi:hypothetical protein
MEVEASRSVESLGRAKRSRGIASKPPLSCVEAWAEGGKLAGVPERSE